MRKRNDHPRERADNLDAVLRTDLARLYAPMEGPSEVEFATALQRRWSQQRNRRQATVMHFPRTHWMFGLALTSVMFAAAIVALSLISNGGPTSFSRAEAFLQEIPDRLPISEGDVLHVRVEHESSFPDASDSASLSQASESWLEVGPNNTVARSFGRIVDSSGTPIQQTIYQPGVWRTIDPRTGDLIRDDEYVPQEFNGPATRAREIQTALSEGRGKVLSLGGNQLTVETREELSERAKDNPPPNLAGRNPVGIVQRVTIRDDGAVLLSETFLTTDAGDLVLVATQRMTIFEVLDEMPAGLF